MMFVSEQTDLAFYPEKEYELEFEYKGVIESKISDGVFCGFDEQLAGF